MTSPDCSSMNARAVSPLSSSCRNWRPTTASSPCTSPTTSITSPGTFPATRYCPAWCRPTGRSTTLGSCLPASTILSGSKVSSSSTSSAPAPWLPWICNGTASGASSSSATVPAARSIPAGAFSLSRPTPPAEKSVGAEAFSPCRLVPVYNHPAKLADTITALRADGLPVVLVDDGSDHECRQLMAALAATTAGIHLIRRPCNGGKGAAVKDGLWAARHHGYSHAIQIDADGQHDISDAVRFLEVAAQRPGALVAGYPAYDASVPRHRYYSRYLSHLWVWINTLSVTIRDSMCGFRVYPVGASCALLDAETMGDRMDFDGEFIVHWVWAGHPL